VGEACDGVLQGALSANVTRPYHQPETCVEPDVGHVIACTWHWISARCHGLVGGCVESFQQIWLPYQPQFEYGKILPCVDAMGRATSIGANGWNPKHT
jgi:hypothetical protein